MFTLDQAFALDALDLRGDGMVAIQYRLTRPGVYQYRIGGKNVSVLKPPEDWTADSFLQSARSVPITLEHPRELMTPSTAASLRGLTESTPAVVRDGSVHHGAVLTHSDAIDAVRSRKMSAVSAGSHVEWGQRSGTWTAHDGSKQDYVMVQLKPRLNHVALTEFPRVPDSRILSLDSEGTAIWVPDSDTDMEELTKLLSKLSLDSATVAALQSLLEARDARVTELTRALDATTGERDALQEKLKAAPSLDSVGAQVANELKTIGAIAAKVPGVSLEALAGAKTHAERLKLALDALKVSVPAEKLKSEEYLQARFDVALDATHPNSARAALLGQDQPTKPATGLTPAERIAAVQAGWKGKR